MPAKQKQAKKAVQQTPEKVNAGDAAAAAAAETPRSPSAAQVEDAVAQPAARRPPQAAEAPRASFISAYFFAASFLVRSVLVPLYGSLSVSGIIGRSSYPSQYTPSGVTCAIEALDGPRFCEHEIIFEEQGVALLSCDPGRGEWNTVMGPLLNPDPKGQLWLYDYADTKTSKQLDLSGFPIQYDFHPLGMTHFSDALKTTLFVVNHQRTGPSIELFTLNLVKGLASSASYERTIQADSLIKSANGIVAMDHTHLYVTNDHAWTRIEAGTSWAMLETFSGSLYGQSWITHIDLSAEDSPAILTKAYQGLAFANGLAKGSDDTLYAVSSVAGTVSLLRPRNATSPVLGFAGDIQFGYSIDNVDIVSTSGPDRVLVGGHPNFLALSSLSRDPHSGRKVSPSWIALASRKSDSQAAAKDTSHTDTKQDWHEPKTNKDWELQTIYEDDGNHYSSSTGAAFDISRDVLIGSGLYEKGLLVCRGVKNIL